jgi:predicted PurR-regulated permease PerM
VLLLMGVPYAVALGLLVAVLDLIPLAGATVAGIVVCTVAFLHTIPAGIVVLAFFIIYQQLENHFLQPVIYGRTVELSPLAVLVSVLVGAELAGILGALAAIPVAGTIQVLVRDQLSVRRGLVIEHSPANHNPPTSP